MQVTSLDVTRSLEIYLAEACEECGKVTDEVSAHDCVALTVRTRISLALACAVHCPGSSIASQLRTQVSPSAQLWSGPAMPESVQDVTCMH